MEPKPKELNLTTRQTGILGKVPPEMRKAVMTFRSELEKLLFYWEDFPINLPDSIFPDGIPPVQLDKMLEVVQYQEPQGPRELSEDQFRSIRKTGTFKVPSVKFPGQHHTWELSHWLQRGSAKNRKIIKKSVGFALDNLLGYTRNRLFSSFLSSVSATRRFCRELVDLPRLLIGYNEVVPRYHDPIREQLAQIQTRVIKNMTPHPQEQFHWVDPNSGEVYDFRLYDEEIFHELQQVLFDLDKDFGLEWNRVEVRNKVQITEDLNLQHPLENPSVEESVLRKQEIEDRLVEFKQEAYYKHLEAFSHRFPQPLMLSMLLPHLRAIRILVEEHDNYDRDLETACREYQEHLKRDHPVLSLSKIWFKRKSANHRKEFERHNLMRILENSLRRMDPVHHRVEHYLLTRHLEVWNTEGDRILAQIKSQTLPKNEMVYRAIIWNPKNWVITKRDGGNYAVEKDVTYKINTKSFGWRLTSSVINGWTTTNNGLYYLIAELKMQFLSLVLPSRFYPKKRVDTKTGQIGIDKSYHRETFAGRLKSVWDNVRRSREDFENAPDTGFLGKNITRVYNVFWNYVVKGFLGSLILCVTLPLWHSSVILFCSLMALLSVLWGPLVCVGTYLFQVFVYDFYGGRGPVPLFALVFKLLVVSLCELFFSLLLAFLIHPLLSVGSVTFGAVRYSLASVYDFLTYYLVIRPYARIPVQNHFLVRRTKGPGLSIHYSYRVEVDLVLLAMTSVLELKELSAYERATRAKITEPQKNLELLGKGLYDSIGANLLTRHALFEEINESTTLIEGDLLRHLAERRRRLSQNWMQGKQEETLNLRHYTVRQTRAESDETLMAAAPLVERFYTEKIFPYWRARARIAREREDAEENEMWKKSHLLPGDWRGLSSKILSDMFGPHITVPLEDEDEERYFFLEIKHQDSSEFVKSIFEGNPRDPLTRADAYFHTSGRYAKVTPRVPFVRSDRMKSEGRHIYKTGYDIWPIEAWSINSCKPKFVLNSVTITSPASSDGHGIVVHLTGKKQSGFSISGIRLSVDGGDFWDAVEKTVGAMVLSVIRGAFYPFDITSFLPAQAFASFSTQVNAKIIIGTGSPPNQRVRFRETAIQKMLTQLQESGDNELVIRVQYRESDYDSWEDDHILCELTTRPSNLLSSLGRRGKPVNLLKVHNENQGESNVESEPLNILELELPNPNNAGLNSSWDPSQQNELSFSIP
eukprot:TRINITY_DN9900_c0_g1_i1.p1 TRINITY_DN9900_c0_g1~~TRINITY_DN9900_c0_g1_i1.p1  ORF type:complete len:1208 (+),score=273.78 TRINITY_DN9900_c0_g1_i1:52-3675(+)